MTEDEKDAARYRYLRTQHWSGSDLAVIVNPKVNARLGSFCPSEELLDAQIDERLGLKKVTYEVVAMRGDFDGYGYKYIDAGSGSDWRTRHPDWEEVYGKVEK